MSYPSRILTDEVVQDKVVMHLLLGSYSVHGAWITARDLRKIFPEKSDDEIIGFTESMSENELFIFRMGKRPKTLAKLANKFEEAAS